MKLLTLSFFALCALILGFGCIYTVDETEQVFLTEFGKIVGKPINADPAKNEAGLHFKKPFIQQVNRIEKRILEWDGPATEMPTRDKLYISVDNFARWRISDPQVYFEKLSNERRALSRLDDIIGSETRSVIASHDLIEVIRSDKDRKPARDEALVAADSNLGNLPEKMSKPKQTTWMVRKTLRARHAGPSPQRLDCLFQRANQS